MALNYPVVFADLGSIVKATDDTHAMAASAATTTFKANRDAILAVLAGNGTGNTLNDVNRVFDTYSDAHIARITTILGLAEQRLLDRGTVVDQLPGATPGDIDRVLRELIHDMANVSSQTINRSNLNDVTSPGPQPDGGNTGNGIVLATSLLDGSPPSPGFPQNLNYVGEKSEISVAETMTLTCTEDADTGALPRGQEQFLLEGQVGWDSQYGWQNEGSGVSVSLQTDNATNIMSNRDVEFWTDAGELESWDSVIGAPGVDFAQESDAANIHRGVSSLKLLGDCRFEQVITNLLLEPYRQYRLSFWYKTEAASTGIVNLNILSPSGAVTIPVGPETPPLNATSGYVHRTALIQLPANLSDDLIFRLDATQITDPVWIDSMSFAPVTYGNGVGYSILAGSTDFSLRDRFTLPVSYQDEGTFQTWFRRTYRIQLPSSASPTIPDSLAQ